MAPDACPPSWPALHTGGLGTFFDGNVSVLVGGNLQVSGAATGAEGTVVAPGDATIARDVPGAYEVGVTGLGSQVTPYAGSDMLVVGGNLAGGLGTHIDVGQGLGGDVVLGGTSTPDTELDTHGGRVYPSVADARAPYADLAAQLPGTSARLAGLATTGTVEVTDDRLSLVGDGVSGVQVFTLDASQLVPAPIGLGGLLDPNGGLRNDRKHRDTEGEGVLGRALQVSGVPDGAAVVVNVIGTDVDLDIDSLISADGTPIDPLTDAAFAGLATHLIWNAQNAATVDLTGLAELPGSLLVPSAGSTTTIANQGTNGRILVGGNLVHTGVGELHAYPYLPEQQLGCTGDPVHLTSLTLDVLVVDPDHIVDPDRVFEGRYKCSLDGVDVTPDDNTWRMRASSDPRPLTTRIPAGASCTVTEHLDGTPAPFRTWGDYSVAPDVVVAAKREPRGFVITNRVKDQPVNQPDPPTSTPTSFPTPTETPTETVAPPPPPTTPPTTPTVTSSTMPEPTNRPTQGPSATSLPAQPSASSPTATASSEPAKADAPNPGGPAGPLTTTAPFTLRGAFVWGPLLMLSLLTMVVRVRRRPQRLH